MASYPVTVYRQRTWHPTPSEYTDTGHGILPRHSIQTHDMAPHPITVCRHRADLSLCYLLMWNVTLEYTTTHFIILGQTRSGNPPPTLHTHQRSINLMMLLWWQSVGNSVERVPYLLCANPLRYPLTDRCFLYWCLDISLIHLPLNPHRFRYLANIVGQDQSHTPVAV